MAFRAAVITFPGSNCDRDMAVAIERASGSAPLRVWHADAELPERLDFIALPGGFSYGDYLRSGAMAANSPSAVASLAWNGVTSSSSSSTRSRLSSSTAPIARPPAAADCFAIDESLFRSRGASRLPQPTTRQDIRTISGGWAGEQTGADFTW